MTEQAEVLEQEAEVLGTVQIPDDANLAVIPQQPDRYMVMIENAVGQGANLDIINQLYAFKQKYEKDEARKAFFVAMAAFKADAPELYKTGKNKHTGSSYTELGVLSEVANPALGKHGLFYNWRLNQEEKIKVTCVLSHVLGHSIETSFESISDKTGSKNDIQAIKSTVSYGESATLSAILGIVGKEQMDDDGNAAGAWLPESMIAGEDLEWVKVTMADVGMTAEKLLVWLQTDYFVKQNGYKVESFDKIPSEWFGDIKASLEARAAS